MVNEFVVPGEKIHLSFVFAALAGISLHDLIGYVWSCDHVLCHVGESQKPLSRKSISGGWGIFIHSCSASLISFEIDCLYGEHKYINTAPHYIYNNHSI